MSIPAEDQVKAALATILANDLFSQSERQQRFLQYIVEQSLSGQADKINQYSIGIDVFDRDASFDPAIDSIVRVEAGRLRSKLREYYSLAGKFDSVRIDVQKGSYNASFSYQLSVNEASVATDNATVGVKYSSTHHSSQKPAIAVLAFRNTSGEVDQDYFADGISEDIITDLARFSELAVISSHSSFSYRDRDVQIKTVREELSADYILSGSIRKSGGRIRVSAQLVDTESEQQLWAERYDHELNDIFAVQDDVREKIILALQQQLDHHLKAGPVHKNTESVEAYDCVLRGTEYARKTNREDMMQAQALFRRAIELDPEYAEAYARLARLQVYYYIGGIDKSQEVLNKADELAQKAAELCPNTAYVRATRGWVYEWLGNSEDAQLEWDKAIELDSSQESAYNYLSLLLAWNGETDKAKEHLEKAQLLNPLGTYHFISGMIHYMESNFQSAVSSFQRNTDVDRAFIPGWLFLASAHERIGNDDAARRALDKLLEINPDYSLTSGSRGIKVPEVRQRFRSGLERLGLQFE